MAEYLFKSGGIRADDKKKFEKVLFCDEECEMGGPKSHCYAPF